MTSPAADVRPEPVHLVIMGVSGSGKTTLARILQTRLGWPYAEADEFHPQANIDKMTAGTPLTDEDRWPWLAAMRDWLTEQARAGRSTIVTCSALRRTYRDVLREAEGRVRFVHLTAAPDVIAPRLDHRAGHFMPPSLLPSQFATLEPLADGEDGAVVVVDVPPEEVADRALAALGIASGPTPDAAEGGARG
ncbi:gluconokinase [Actinotalea fermentans]|uniref:Gluconokinase n=1 Tax=Actinotalea fermentans TaxID=43671 RepID=A0A511Z191_9CELL|nr:gluconokinase [Actinotalea fermentans]KGM16412.1 gluconate kinase [Actinotalea fermentans ATCC 43279 = JCM 9966 = DSM 3133]GEN81136.1 gluconokinase [Actinotalea fermentans]